MEFQFDTNSVLHKEITILVGRRRSNESRLRSEKESRVADIADAMGIASAKAQGLLSPVTSFARLNFNQETLYILKGHHEFKNKGVAIGILKTGRRRLFLCDGFGKHHEVEPLSVLDFYVHESRQKCGHGKKLFEFMLKEEGLQAWEVAIDRPSFKFLNFLKKNYDLTRYINQANRYVVFDNFFKTCKDFSQKSRFSMPSQSTSSSNVRFKTQCFDRTAPGHVLTTRPSPPSEGWDSVPSLESREASNPELTQPPTSDCATDIKAISHSAIDMTTGNSEKVTPEFKRVSSNNELKRFNSGSNAKNDAPGYFDRHNKNYGIPHPHMTTLTRSDLPSKAVVPSPPRVRKLGISSLATNGFGINSLGFSSIRPGEERQNKMFEDVHDKRRNTMFGNVSVASNYNECKEELAPYLNMRHIRNGRRKSDITSPSCSSPNYSAAPSYNRHHLPTNQNILQCTKPKPDSLQTSQFSPQAKSKDNWRQFIT